MAAESKLADDMDGVIARVPTPMRANTMLKPRKSCGIGHTRVTWEMAECEQVARETFKMLPETIHCLMGAGPFMGNLIAVSSEQFPPSKDDLKNNYAFLKPLVRHYARKVPSGYFIADVLLCMDALFSGNLITARAMESKRDRALGEANKLKRMISTLRHLRRKTENSTCDEVADLKRLVLRKAPTKSDEAEDAELLQACLTLVDLMGEEEAEAVNEVLHLMSSAREVAEVIIEYTQQQADELDASPIQARALSFADSQDIDSQNETQSAVIPASDSQRDQLAEQDRAMYKELFGDSQDAAMLHTPELPCKYIYSTMVGLIFVNYGICVPLIKPSELYMYQIYQNFRIIIKYP